MADIAISDDSKLMLRLVLGLLRKRGSIKTAHTDMRNCANKAYYKPYLLLIETAAQIKRNHQKSILADLGTYFLRIIYKDTAYNPITLYILKKLINDKEFVKLVNEQGVDSVDELYVNNWSDTLDITKKAHEENKLNPFELSREEKTFVPNIQHAVHAKYNEQELINSLEQETKKEMRTRIRKS